MSVRALSPVAFALAVLAGVALLDGPTGRGQPAPAAAVYGPTQCIGCHGGPDTPAYKAYEKDGTTNFVLMTEYQTWHSQDLHAQAFANIEPKAGSLAGVMQSALAGSRPEGYRIDKAAECLACHAVATADKAVFHTKDGVSCEACHGTAEKWFAPHVLPAWRSVEPAEKAKLGLNDLRDPSVRGAKCASCHVGNKAEGKFVTHEMYAAGHPPLPAFDLVTFGRDQPRHYRPHRENTVLAGLDAAGQARFHFRDPKEHCPEARDLALGGLAAFESGMGLLADDAKATADAQGLLDFAHFDCYACHHDLRADGGRPQPRPGLRPGQPPMRPLGVEPLRAVLEHAGTERAKAFDDDLAKLNKAFSSRPFGDAAEVASVAAALRKRCEEARPDLAKAMYTKEETRRLLDLLGKRALSDIPDHDSAQQTAWSVSTLRRELGMSATSKKVDGVTAFSLLGKPGEPIAPRVAPRQAAIGKYRSADFKSAMEEWLKEK